MSPCTHDVSSGISGTSIDSSWEMSAVIVANPPVPVRTPRPAQGRPLGGGQLVQELQAVCKFVDLECDVDASLSKRDVVDPRVADHGPGVRLRHHPSALGAPELECHDGLAGLERLGGSREERLGAADLLEREGDDACRLVLDEVLEIVGHVRDRLVAGGDHAG